VTLRYWAAAREAAGHAEERLDASSAADLRAQLAARGGRLAAITAISTLLLADGSRLAAGSDRPLGDGDVVEVLPPFAGG